MLLWVQNIAVRHAQRLFIPLLHHSDWLLFSLGGEFRRP